MKKLRRLKKGLAVLLTAAMTVGLMSGAGTVKVSGAQTGEAYISPDSYSEPSTDGSGVYQLSTAEHLFWFAEQVNSGSTDINAVLTTNITVNEGVLKSDGTLNSGSFTSWTPIGNSLSNAYSGTFDGKGYTISGLYFKDTQTNGVGLFGRVGQKGSVSNVGIVDSYFSGGLYVGGVCGNNYGSIKNCYHIGTVAGNSAFGGVCGFNNANSGSVKNCYYTGTVTPTNSSSRGGVCGTNKNTITNCYYDNEKCSLGGIDGSDAEGKAEGRTTAQFASGEVAYLLQGDQTEAVWGQTLTGDDKQAYPVLKKTGDTDNTVYQYTNCSGSIAYTNDSTLSGVTQTSHELSGQSVCNICGKAIYTVTVDKTDLTNADAVTDKTKVTEDDTVTVTITSGDYAKFQTTPVVTVTAGMAGEVTAAGDGIYTCGITGINADTKITVTGEAKAYSEPPKDADGVYQLSEPSHLCWFAEHVNSGNPTVNAVLTADIDFSSSTFISIGNTENNKFSGVFDGCGHTITVNQSDSSNVAIFGYIGNCTIKNLTVTGTINTGVKYAAGIAMKKAGDDTANIENCISDVTIVSSVSGDGTHGGIIGNVDGTININNCAFTGAINGESTNACGGIIGWTQGSANIKNSYVSASFGISSTSGNIVSRKGSSSTVNVSNCYYLNELNAIQGSITKKSEEEFASGEVAYLLQGDQTKAVWGQTLTGDDKQAYPVLKKNGDTDNTVYQYADCAGNKAYTNDSSLSGKTVNDHDFSDDDVCIRCGKTGYNITIVKTELVNANAVADKTKATGTDSVTITIIPNYGRFFKTIPTVSVTAGTAGEVTDAGDGTYKCQITGITANTTITVTGTAETKSVMVKVTVENDGNGTATADKTTALEGTTVNLTATANSGYTFKEWVVTGEGASVADKSAAATTLTVGKADVTVKATFKKKTVLDEAQVKAFVERLYNNILGRAGDEEGIGTWVTALADGTLNGATASYGFVNSDEFRNSGLSNEQKVEIFYATFLNRVADEAGKKMWADALNAGVDIEKIFEGFVMSTEFAGICDTYGISQGQMSDIPGMTDILNRYRNRNIFLASFVARCYEKALGRPADVPGVDVWCAQIIEGYMTPRNVAADGFFHSDEFIAKNTTNAEYVSILYQTFLGRELDQEGYEMWVGLLDRNEWTRDEVLDGFANSDEFGSILASFGLN